MQRRMRSIAVYSLKGGVGKTSIAVNLAWAAAALSSRKTLLWDLDGQAASTFLLGAEARPPPCRRLAARTRPILLHPRPEEEA